MQLFRTVVLLRKFCGAVLSFEQGSLIVWSNREAVPNSSPIDGARKPSA